MRPAARILLCLLLPALLAPALPQRARAQFTQSTVQHLLEEYSLQLFGENARGFMQPVVVVSNIGSNHGFFHSAAVPKEDGLHLQFSLQSVFAWVNDDDQSYTGHIPYESRATDSDTLKLFKALVLQPAVRDGQLDPEVTSATVFGGPGAFFRIPKGYLFFLPDSVKALFPDSLQLGNGTNQRYVLAAVPQLQIGTWKHTDMLLRYVPPVTFDTAIGKFSFFGVALRHGFTNWFRSAPVDAAVQVSYQHTTIDNKVGDTRAILAASTDMLSVNVHASRRFAWFEPYMGLSLEYLTSTGSYTFTLPKKVVDQIHYDIAPQRAEIDLDDTAVKLTVGATAHLGGLEAFVSAGISKHFILGAGLAYNFDIPLRR
jgi:hypothetical protein